MGNVVCVAPRPRPDEIRGSPWRKKDEETPARGRGGRRRAAAETLLPHACDRPTRPAGSKGQSRRLEVSVGIRPGCPVVISKALSTLVKSFEIPECPWPIMQRGLK